MISILTFNIHGLPGFITGDNTQERMARINKLLKNDLSKDIVLLNEAFVHRETLLHDIEYTYPYITSLGRKTGKILNSGLTILSKYPITEVKKKFYGTSRNWDFFASKGLLAIKIDLPDQKIYIVSTHMQAGAGICDQYARIQQVKDVIEFISTFPHNSSIIFAGDLNMGPIFKMKKNGKVDPGHYYNERDAIDRTTAYKKMVKKCRFEETVKDCKWIVRFLVKNVPGKWSIIKHSMSRTISDTSPLEMQLFK